MELKQYIKIIKQHIKLVAAVLILVGTFAFVFSAIRPITYETSLSLLISRTTIQETEDYKYDGYYAIQANDLFANTTVGWLKSPEIVVAIYKEAGVSLSAENLRKLEKNFKAFKTSPHSVEVKFKSKTKKDAQSVVKAAVSVLEKKTKIIGRTSQEEIAFSIIGSEPVIVEKKPNLILNTMVGLISGIFLGILLVFSKEYFKESNK